jgi:hypothetical protein
MFFLQSNLNSKQKSPVNNILQFVGQDTLKPKARCLQDGMLLGSSSLRITIHHGAEAFLRS